MSELTDKVVEKGKKGVSDVWTTLTGTPWEISNRDVNDHIFLGIVGLELLSVIPAFDSLRYGEFSLFMLPVLDVAVRGMNMVVDEANRVIRPYFGKTYFAANVIGVIGNARRFKHKYF